MGLLSGECMGWLIGSTGPYGTQRKKDRRCVSNEPLSQKGDQSGNIQQVSWLQSRMEVGGVGDHHNVRDIALPYLKHIVSHLLVSK